MKAEEGCGRKTNWFFFSKTIEKINETFSQFNFEDILKMLSNDVTFYLPCYNLASIKAEQVAVAVFAPFHRFRCMLQKLNNGCCV